MTTPNGSAWAFLLRNWTLAKYGATWSATSSVPTLPVSHLGLPQRQRVWRSTGTTGQALTVNLGVPRAVGGIALVDGNLTSGATVRLEGNPIDTWPGAVSHTLVPWAAPRSGVLVDFFAGPETYQWWRLSMTDAANPNGWLQLGVIVLGQALRWVDVAGQARGPGVGVARRRIDPSLVGRSPSGTPYGFQFPQRDDWRLPTGLLSKTQMLDTLLAELEEVGLTEDLVMSLDADDPHGDVTAIQSNLYGRLTELPELSGSDAPYYRGALAFQESR